MKDEQVFFALTGQPVPARYRPVHVPGWHTVGPFALSCGECAALVVPDPDAVAVHDTWHTRVDAG